MSSKPNISSPDAGIPFLEMIAGTEKGKVYDLYADRIRLGRNADNDIVIVSDAVSRYHAMMERTEDGNWCVLDNQSKNGVSVNGVRVERSVLADGDVVQVGDFIFRFNGNLRNTGIELEGAAASGDGDHAGGHLAGDIGGYSPVVTKPARPNRRVLIYGGAALLLAFVWLMNQNGSSNKSADGDSTQQTDTKDGKDDQKLARDFDVTKKPELTSTVPPEKPPGREDPILTGAEQQLSRIDLSNTPAVQAEQYFRRGLREFMNKNWQRAIDDFKTVLALNRGHEMAGKYLQLSMYESETEAKTHMANGVRYFESLQYARAMYDFKQVIELMQHRPNEPIIGEADKYITICKQRLQAAELLQ